MSEPEYEYYGLMVSTWDLFRGDTSKWDDRFFFLDIVRESGEPALDVGCSTGRLLLDYLSQGIDIDGVDLSPEMLVICRQKAEAMGLEPTLYQQSMTELDLPRRYQTMIVPSSSFQLLLNPADAEKALGRFYDHLKPGGTLAMPFMLLWQEGEPLEQPWKLTGEKVRPEDGATVRRWSRAWYDPENQLEHTEDRYELIQDGEVVATEFHRQSPATRWYTQEQVAEMLKRNGFSDIQFFSRFTHEPASEGDTLFTVTCKSQ